ncbi:hypothetical protein O3S81_25475 [Agrobacterium sp. SOY23]|uniref:electron transfer flavoprotein subunit beta/FixA family protein n=1 Tax=Agrobacterium sp. SOY23 TaxID=3014555 RepID=UPI0022B02A58|nr:hypothetical protein [Agrobacterium sp. SOY23]MCZ4433063.1 hypothetical protein [Agrobacterium sp. SOY23]
MKIAVLMRLVPNLSEGVDLNEDGTDVDREWTDTQANETDEQALEEALVVKEATGATVTAVALSDEGVQRLLRSALAKGADDVVELDLGIEQAQALSSAATAQTIADWLSDQQFDVILVGNQKVDDPFGGLAAHLSAALELSVIAGATQVNVPDTSRLRILQEYGGGNWAWIEFSGKAVIGVQAASRPIRYISGSKLRDAMANPSYQKVSVSNDRLRTNVPSLKLEFPQSVEGIELIADPAEAAARLMAILEERNYI